MKKQNGFVPLIIILGIVAILGIAGGAYYLGKFNLSKSPTQNLVITSQTGQITPIPSSNRSSINSVTPKTSIIKLLDNKIPTDNSTFVKGGPAICQPEFFDPKTTKFHKVKTSGLPAQLYEIEGEHTPTMMIDGWYNEGEKKVHLEFPYDLTVYEFGCASSSTNVLDLTNNGQRQALYTHILNWSISDDKRNLYLVNNLKNSKGEWELLKRIINIVTNKATKLPNLDCVDQGRWDEDRLITYSDKNKASLSPAGSTYQTQVCIWNNEGKLLYKLQGDLDWYGASKDGLWSLIGFLPKDKNIFYAYKTGSETDPPQCQLYLQDLTNQNRWKVIDLFTRNNPSGLVMCSADIKFNFTDTTFENPILKYDNANSE